MKRLFILIFLLATNHMLMSMEPLYVACKIKGCSFRCKNDPILINAHKTAHKEAGSDVFYCDQCNKWAYTNNGLKAHKRKIHPPVAQPNSMPPPTQSITATPATQVLSYRAFCALESRLHPEYADIRKSTSAVGRQSARKLHYQKEHVYETIFCECCQQFIDQHSYKNHVLLNHQELYDFNHLALVKSQQTDPHQQDS